MQHERAMWSYRNDYGREMDAREVLAAVFKANCLRIMDEVARQRIPIIITKGESRF